MNIIANPLYFPPTHFSHPAFGPWTIAGVEGLMWGLILWRWSHGRKLAILLGFAINAATVALFWLAMHREQYLWDYDYQVVSIGEICVVVAEAGAATWYLSRILNRSPSTLWIKVLGISILLNALSFFMGAYFVQSPIPSAEIAEGARKAGQNASTRQDVNRAQLVMGYLIDYKKDHGGSQPTKLEELAKIHLIPDAALRCILADGHEEPWGYETGNRGDDEVILFSPGKVDSEGQYIVGLGDGRVLGLHDTDLDLEKVPRLKMSIVPDK